MKIWLNGKRIYHGGPQQCKTDILNIFTDKPGPASYSKSRIIDGEAFSAFNLIININMVQYIKNCNNTGACRVLGREDWVLSVEELYLHLLSWCKRSYCQSTIEAKSNRAAVYIVYKLKQ